jgi:cyclophilin family peptidyl-prolyl cis-trans isomerase/HEAT repeat protein
MKTVLIAVLAAACARPTPAPRLRPEVDSALQEAELSRFPNPEARSLLSAPEMPTRVRAALAVGRIGDPEAIPRLEQLLADEEVGPVAAWALGRIEGGTEPLVRCLQSHCTAEIPAARALSGPAAVKRPAVDALIGALSGQTAREAAVSLGVLARNKEVRFPPGAYTALAAALQRPDTRAAAAYALSRLPRGEAIGSALATALRDGDRSMRLFGARAWGRQELPAQGLRELFADPDWRVRVEAARGLSNVPGAAEALRAAFNGQTSPHVVVALSEAAVQVGEMPPEVARFSDPISRCAVAQARDKVRKQLVDTPRCDDSGWRTRARAAAIAAELGLPQARDGFRDADGRVRGATAGAAGTPFADDLRRLLGDPDAYVVQEAAASLAKLPRDQATKEAALAAARRLLPAHLKSAGDAESDALTALIELTGPLPELLPTPNPVLAAALGQRVPVPVPPEARSSTQPRLLRLRTNRGELVVDLRRDVAPLTASALAALANRGFYNGLAFHRVVPDFVVQGGDPRGDGDGGPGWALPDEHSPLRFVRGTLGIATSGAETGGSQFFLCHSPQPHLDGRYTVAGQLRSGEEVLDELQPGDTIVSASAE